VQVAQLAGLPKAVVDRARVVLEALEKGEREGPAQKALIDDLPLFAASPSPTEIVKTGPNPLEQRLADVHPDSLSPREALDLLYELKALNEESVG
jgi:DNA mismatch repair protein MutS